MASKHPIVEGFDDKWEFYKDASKQWRWRRTAANGKVVAVASEGYKNKKDAEENARRSGYKLDAKAKAVLAVLLG